MKYLIILLIVLQPISELSCQSKLDNFKLKTKDKINPILIATGCNQNVYKTIVPCTLTRTYRISTKTAEVSATQYILSANLKYKVIEESDDGIWIQLLPCLQFDAATATGEIPISFNSSCLLKGAVNNPSDYYYKIEDDLSPNNHCLISESIMGMPVTLPLKIRKLDGDLEFEPNLSLGYTFGWRFKLNKNPYRKRYLSLIPLAFAINEDSYFYKTGQDADGNNLYSTPTDNISFTYYSFGATLEFNGFNVGGFFGWDRMFGPQADWAYQKQRWFSIGLGYKFGGD